VHVCTRTHTGCDVPDPAVMRTVLLLQHLQAAAPAAAAATERGPRSAWLELRPLWSGLRQCARVHVPGACVHACNLMCGATTEGQRGIPFLCLPNRHALAIMPCGHRALWPLCWGRHAVEILRLLPALCQQHMAYCAGRPSLRGLSAGATHATQAS